MRIMVSNPVVITDDFLPDCRTWAFKREARVALVVDAIEKAGLNGRPVTIETQLFASLDKRIRIAVDQARLSGAMVVYEI